MKKSRLQLIISMILVITAMAIVTVHDFASTDSSTRNISQLIVNFIAIISGISGLIIGLISLRTANLDNVREYFVTGDQEHITHARVILYAYLKYKRDCKKSIFDSDFKLFFKEQYLTKDDVIQAVSTVANFFHLWGLLTKKDFLPLWVFEDASGVSVLLLYEASKDVIDRKRIDNPYYAKNFEYLNDTIKAKYKHTIY